MRLFATIALSFLLQDVMAQLYIPYGTATGGTTAPSNGYVGIGTNTPQAYLHAGKPEASGGTAGEVMRIAIQPYGHTGGPWYFKARDNSQTAFLDFLYGTTHAMTINSSGYVGIGTTSPSQKLSVYNPGSETQILIGNPSSSTGGFTNLALGTSTDTGGYGWLQAVKSAGSSYGDIILNQYGGNVGIGTASPDSKLSVGGNLSLTYFGTVSSNRSSNNNYTNLFLGAGLNEQNGIYKVLSDGGSNYFAGIKMDNSGGNVGAIKFYTGPSTGPSSYNISNTDLENYLQMSIINGKVGIGTTNLDAKLTVKGDIHTREVRVDVNGGVGPDYVFEKDYNLLPLSEVEAYINQNKHLPEVPSAKEMEKDGLNLKEMNLLLLKKVEELTLHVIEQEKRIKELENKK